MKKIRILMVIGNTRMGGAQAFLLNVLRNIDQERFQIDLAINFYAECNGIEDECRALGCEIYILPYFKVYNYISYQRIWNQFLSTHHYDIVYAHSTNSASVFLKIAKKHGCKTIAHSHSAGYRGNKLEQLTKKFFTRGVKDVADYWFACSDKAAERLYGNNYKNYPHFYYIPNAIDAEKYRFESNTRKKIRDELGIGDDVLLCGHIGTFSVPKNHIFLINVFAEVLKKEPNARLVCCGTGALLPTVKQQAKELGVLDKIFFTGVVQNANEYLMAMDVFVFPSIFEGFPVSILEAQATGLPIVMSDIITKDVDLTDLIIRQNLSKTPTVWADMVVSAFAKHNMRDTYNSAIAESKYNIKETVKEFERLYTELYHQN